MDKTKQGPVESKGNIRERGLPGAKPEDNIRTAEQTPTLVPERKPNYVQGTVEPTEKK